MKCVIKPVFHLEMELSQDEINQLYDVFAFSEGATTEATMSEFTFEMMNLLKNFKKEE